jgi:hypothetical protein
MSKNITLEQFEILKNNLDHEICHLISEFANETGFIVKSIDIELRNIKGVNEIYLGVKSNITDIKDF